MSDYVSKQQLQAELEEYLKNLLTVAELEKARSFLLELLSRYDVMRLETLIDPVAGSKDFLKMFTDAKIVEGRSPKTISRYIYILNQFFNAENVTAQGTSVYHIRDYFMRRKEKGSADSTIAGIRDIFNSFFGWCFNEGLISKNPCANVGTIKVEEKVRKSFSSVDVQKLINACDNYRDRAIVLFLLNTGVRVSELCDVRYTSFQFEQNECLIHGKGNRQRFVYYDDVTKWIIGEYLEETKTSNEGHLFLGKGGKPLMPGGVRNMLKKLERISGVENVHPHRFRRTFATIICNRGMPIEEVKGLLGHKKIDTTLGYIYQTKERTKNAYFTIYGT